MDNNIQQLIEQISLWQAKSRLLYKDGALTKWSNFLISPVPNYLETDAGPIPSRLISAIDIYILKQVHIGRLIKPKIVDLTTEILEYLNNLDLSNNREDDNFIRVYL